MLTVEWLDSAIQDVIEIIDYISQFDPVAARNMKDLFISTAEKIPDQPYAGRLGLVAGTREKIPHPRYRMIYRVTHTTIEIVSIVHTSRMYPFE